VTSTSQAVGATEVTGFGSQSRRAEDVLTFVTAGLRLALRW